DAERIALAATGGQITLALRNPLDQKPVQTSGIRLVELMKPAAPAPERVATPLKRVTPPPAPAPVAVVAPQIYKIEAIRASKRSEETVQ
ncbi:MAG TPA: hypothetical protein VFP91_10355, partial [Vicinamibacterales bacterium]|nr:hypothetical protein [Vicinamibacterales bacterium]